MTPAPWLLVGLAVAIAPVRSRDGTSPRRPSRDVLQWGAAVCAGCAVAVLLGGIAGLAAAVPVALVAGGVTRRLADREPGTRPDASLPLTLDLVAAALRAGCPVDAAVAIGAAGASDPIAVELERVAALLRLGAEPAEAWRAIDNDAALASVAVIARRSASSGVRLAAAFERLADELRRDAAAHAEARAQRAGVWAIAPLGLCFLPAFVCLGVVPVVVGIARIAFLGLG